MIDLSENQIEELKQLAQLPGQTFKDICIIMQLDFDLFLADIANPESVVHKAYFTGRATSNIAFEKKVKQLSDQGSGPAQTLFYKLLNRARIRELLEFYG